MFLIDSHCHIDCLNYKSLHKNVEDVIKKAKNKNVKLILAVCTTLNRFKIIEDMIKPFNNILLSCGIHPYNCHESYNLEKLNILAKKKNVIAIGETGLDYYYNNDNKIKQKIMFRIHVKLGKLLNKPIIIHMRESSKDIISILNEKDNIECKGVIHCFTENKLIARTLLDMGFYISFSGIITFNNNYEIRKVIKYIPLDRLLLETDSPYLTPVPYRGKQNQPAYIYDIAKYISILKNITLEKLSIITSNNFCNLFNINIYKLL